MIFSIEPNIVMLGQYGLAQGTLSSTKDWSLRPHVANHDKRSYREYGFDGGHAEQLRHLQLDVDSIFILLPECDEEPSLCAEVRYLQDLAPQIFEHSNVLLFPFGSASIAMALRHAKQQFEKEASRIAFVSIHLKNQFEIKNNVEGIISDSLIVATLTKRDHGLQVYWNGYEVHTKDKTLSVPIASLLNRVNQSGINALAHCYLPIAFDDELKQSILSNVNQLSSMITSKTEFVFLDILLGNLGACAGLYSLCHLSEQYQKCDYSGYTLQLDVAERRYRSVLLIGWSQ
ncbi:hypothetical protein [Vibrio sp. 10N]|uniref:hypothetical protein n=1 Tax=Vibrio sp. 10N TaxID=3058938 RepID=UPI002814518F|nr:hypothetical protein VB10N_10020 [Vibrio sp. 10N]